MIFGEKNKEHQGYNKIKERERERDEIKKKMLSAVVIRKWREREKKAKKKKSCVGGDKKMKTDKHKAKVPNPHTIAQQNY